MGGSLQFLSLIWQIFSSTQRAETTHFRPEEGHDQHNEDSSHTTACHGEDGAEQLRSQARFKTAQFIGSSDKKRIDRRNAATHSVWCAREQERAPNDHTDIIETAQQEKHQ